MNSNKKGGINFSELAQENNQPPKPRDETPPDQPETEVTNGDDFYVVKHYKRRKPPEETWLGKNSRRTMYINNHILDAMQDYREQTGTSYAQQLDQAMRNWLKRKGYNIPTKER